MLAARRVALLLTSLVVGVACGLTFSGGGDAPFFLLSAGGSQRAGDISSVPCPPGSGCASDRILLWGGAFPATVSVVRPGEQVRLEGLGDEIRNGNVSLFPTRARACNAPGLGLDSSITPDANGMFPIDLDPGRYMLFLNASQPGGNRLRVGSFGLVVSRTEEQVVVRRPACLGVQPPPGIRLSPEQIEALKRLATGDDAGR